MSELAESEGELVVAPPEWEPVVVVFLGEVFQLVYCVNIFKEVFLRFLVCA